MSAIILTGTASVSLSAQLATSTRTTVESLMKSVPPRLSFSAAKINADSFPKWQAEISAAMSRLMCHPDYVPQPPVKVAAKQRDGYRIERWLSFPLQGSVVPFFALIPDGIKADENRPAVLCIPGFGQTKELLAGELTGNYDLASDSVPPPAKNAMARQIVREGFIAVAVDNPACGELSDGGVNDYVDSSRFLLEMGWNYLGLTSWQDKVILDWMKMRPEIRADRIIVSGFSLGTEPLMVLGAIDKSIYAFVYNDFLCRTRERALRMNKRDSSGARHYPNNIEHLIPGFLTEFDFPDLVAALAPRPVICTEGGMDRDFKVISKAYGLAGATQNFVYHHYAKYADDEDRVYLEEMPDGVGRDDFFRLANVDPQNHYFKTEHVIPWLRSLLSR
jgi:hypothetical protein